VQRSLKETSSALRRGEFEIFSDPAGGDAVDFVLGPIYS